MDRKTWISAVIISAGFAAMSTSQAYQKISRSKVDDKVVTAPHYELGATYEAPSTVPDGPSMSVVQISIDASNFNRDDLLRLVQRLKRDFCKEERLFAVLFDDAAYIK